MRGKLVTKYSAKIQNKKIQIERKRRLKCLHTSCTNAKAHFEHTLHASWPSLGFILIACEGKEEWVGVKVRRKWVGVRVRRSGWV